MTLREHLEAVCDAFDQVTTIRSLLEPTCEADERELRRLQADVAEARAALESS